MGLLLVVLAVLVVVGTAVGRLVTPAASQIDVAAAMVSAVVMLVFAFPNFKFCCMSTHQPDPAYRIVLGRSTPIA